MAISTVIAALLALTAASCDFRPLKDADNNLEVAVAVNIKAISNVSCDIYNENIPVPEINTDMMHVMFFKPETGKVVAESYISDHETITDEDGDQQTVLSGKINVLPGTYEMMIYNFDTQSTLIRNYESYTAIEAYTDKVPESISTRYSTRADGDGDMLFQPDHLVVAKNEAETIPYHSGLYVIKSEAKSIVESYYLQIKVDGLQYVSSAQAVLSGMVGSKFLSKDGSDAASSEADLYFSLVKSQSPRDGNADVICGIFNTFGRIEESDNDLYVIFDVKTVYGTEKTYKFNITDKFSTAECIDHHWILIDDTIKIDPPPPGSAGGGFDPVIEDWDKEDHNVIF